MQKLKTEIRRLLYRLRHDVFTKDHSFLLIVAAVCLIFVVSAISAMSRNWELEQRLATEKARLALLQLEVETEELENHYYQSEEYQDLSARRHLNKKLPGENLVYLPENSAAAKTKHSDPAPGDSSTPSTSPDSATTDSSATDPANQEPASSLSEWLRFLFGS